jgi:hypothetical protein
MGQLVLIFANTELEKSGEFVFSIRSDPLVFFAFVYFEQLGFRNSAKVPFGSSSQETIF